MTYEVDPQLQSMAERLALMDPEERGDTLDRVLDGAGPKAIEDLYGSWEFWARPNQLPPGPGCHCGCDGRWLYWVILAGRGWGKTRTGAEWVHRVVNDGEYKLLHLVGATASDARDIMVLGESGILATQKPDNRVRWSPTKRRLTWENGAEALIFSADEPDRLRGLQCEAAWCDELAAWRYPEAWKQLQLGLRLGPYPRTVITTTPRPKKLVKDLVISEQAHVTRGTTYENVTNLAEAFMAEITREFEGSRFGRQEIYADILDESELAYWNRDMLDDCRVDVRWELDEEGNKIKELLPADLKLVVVGVDVAVSFGEESAETGIVVAGIDQRDVAWVIADNSGKYRPDGWAKKVCALYHAYNNEGLNVRVVAEKNMGYDLIKHTIEVEDPDVPVKLVHASKSKLTRAEPIATAYERGRVKHYGVFETLEEQMCTWEAGDTNSPDRLDAMVWALTELIVTKKVVSVVPAVDNELGMGDQLLGGSLQERGGGRSRVRGNHRRLGCARCRP
jgi:phage terminase large subunit-like protein